MTWGHQASAISAYYCRVTLPAEHPRVRPGLRLLWGHLVKERASWREGVGKSDPSSHKLGRCRFWSVSLQQRQSPHLQALEAFPDLTKGPPWWI